MITYLPEIYPDELVYSWFCRYYVHSGCFNSSMALKELLKKRSNNPSKEFIGNLNPEAKEKITKMYDMDYLILNHTMFPQYARFLPASEKKDALYKLGHEFCDAHYLFAILPREEGEKHLRYCPVCALEDRQKYRETYWHRKHQIRNMSICPKHRCKLIESNVLAKSEQEYTLRDAESNIEDIRAESIENPLIIHFASFLERVFDASINMDNDTPLNSILYDGMCKTKYLKPSGRSRYTRMLADDMKGYYEDLGICNIASMYQVQRAVLGTRFEFSVACQIAFFLEMQPEELTNPSLTRKQIEQEQKTHYMTDNAPIDWNQFDEETAPILEQVARDIYNGVTSETGRPERVSEKIVYRELGLHQHRLENMPKCRAIFEKYTESYPESWARKIIWAYQKLKSENGNAPFYWSDIRLLAGVKKHNFEKVVPYLGKYTDKDTVEEIIEIVGTG